MNKHFRLLFCTMFGLLWLLSACSPYVVTQTPAPTVTEGSVSPSPAPSPVPAATPETCKVSTGDPAGRLNMRVGTGMSYAVVRVLNDGEPLTVIADGSWLEVKDAQGNHGYINSKYCK